MEQSIYYYLNNEVNNQIILNGLENYSKQYIPIDVLRKRISIENGWRVLLNHKLQDLKNIFYGNKFDYDHIYEVNIYRSYYRYKFNVTFGNIWNENNELMLQICVNKKFISRLFEQKNINKQIINKNIFLLVKGNIKEYKSFNVLKDILLEWNKSRIIKF